MPKSRTSDARPSGSACRNPPLTEQIQTLEASLQVKLFERSPRGAQLTAAGAAILPAVRKLADHMQQLEVAVREAVAGQIGLITIGAISSAMLDVLPPLLDRFRRSHPGITLAVREIDSADALPMLRTGQIDVAFARLEHVGDEDVEISKVKEDKLAVALPRDHALAASPRVKLASLAGEDFVMFAREVSPDYFDGVIAACRAHGFAPRVLHEVRTVASQVAFVGCGQGAALVPSALRSLAPANVVVRPLREEIRVVTTAMAWSRRRPNLLVDHLRGDLMESIKAPPASKRKASGPAAAGKAGRILPTLT